MCSTERSHGARRTGRFLLPVALGLLIGFWCADQGMRFVPEALALTAAVVLLACGLLTYEFHQSDPRPTKRYRASIAFMSGSCFTVCLNCSLSANQKKRATVPSQ